MSSELEDSFYEDEPKPSHYRSQRFPDVHGGQPDAAAEPDHRIEKMEVQEPYSQGAIERRQQNIQKMIHGDSEPKSHLPVLLNIHNTNIEILKTLKSIEDLMAFQVPIGQVRAFTLAYKGPAYTHIDFQDPTQTFGILSGIGPVNEPQRKLTRLDILNDGPGNIKFATNLPKSDLNTEALLGAGESESLDFKNTPTIWSVNLAVTSGISTTPTVRFFYII